MQVRALSPEALERIRRATEAEWRAQVGPARRRWMPLAAAAASLFAAVAAWMLWSAGTDQPAGAPLARVQRAEAPGVVELRSWWREAPVTAGAELRAGQRLD